MLQLPLAFAITLVAILMGTAVFAAGRIPSRTRLLLTAFFALLAAMFALVGIRDGYGIELARSIQPVIAMMIQPTLYLAFNALTEEPPTSTRALLLRHGWPALLVAVFMGLASIQPRLSLIPVDVFVFPSLAFYLVRLVGLLRAGPDEFIQVTAPGYRLTVYGLVAGIGLFGFVLVLDVAIFISQRLFSGAYSDVFVQVSVTSIAAAMILLALAAALYIVRYGDANNRRGGPPGLSTDTRGGEGPSQEDREIFNALEELLVGRELYRDSGITLARISRRLGRPAREISLAVNRCSQENFSRYINGHRVRHAQELLSGTEAPITEVMLESGFSTKSNFNTEFKRLVGGTPSTFRKESRANTVSSEPEVLRQ